MTTTYKIIIIIFSISMGCVLLRYAIAYIGRGIELFKTTTTMKDYFGKKAIRKTNKWCKKVVKTNKNAYSLKNVLVKNNEGKTCLFQNLVICNNTIFVISSPNFVNNVMGSKMFNMWTFGPMNKKIPSPFQANNQKGIFLKKVLEEYNVETSSVVCVPKLFGVSSDAITKKYRTFKKIILEKEKKGTDAKKIYDFLKGFTKFSDKEEKEYWLKNADDFNDRTIRRILL